MNTIITIFIIIVVVSLIRNVKSAIKEDQSKSGGHSPTNKKPAGLGKLIGDLITQVRDEMERQAQASKGASTPNTWDALRSKPQKVETSQPKPPLPTASSQKDRPAISPREDATDQRRGPKRSEESIKQNKVSKAATPTPGVQTRQGRKVTRRKLREAVIWAEIIGPPVALKNRQREL